MKSDGGSNPYPGVYIVDNADNHFAALKFGGELIVKQEHALLFETILASLCESVDAIERRGSKQSKNSQMGNTDIYSEILSKAEARRREGDPMSIEEIAFEAKKIEQSNIQALARLIHYPDCWDTTAYPTFADVLKELGCNPADCTKNPD